MKNLTKIIPMIILTIFISINLVSAQKVTVVTVAEVGIYNATSTKINNNTYSVSFRIKNDVGIQPNIRYGISLVKKSDSKSADLQLENEAITLGEGEYKDITIKYSIPKFIEKGVYNLYIIAKNENGLLLGYAPAGSKDANITISKNILNPKIEHCYLTIKSEENSTSSKTYTNDQGVDIKSTENLIANCKILNPNSGDIIGKIQLITHKRDQFGDILANNILDKEILLKTNKVNDVSFDIPVMSNPQAYDIDMFLIDKEGKQLSTSYFIHYVMVGPSATLQNTILDKESYKVGDIAELQAFWTPSADSFDGSRHGGTKNSYSLTAKIYDKDNNICGAINKDVKIDPLIGQDLLKINILKDCGNAIAKVTISDKDGKVLDNSDINLNDKVKEINISVDTEPKGFNKIYALVFVIVLVLIGYGILVLKKSRENEINKSK